MAFISILYWIGSLLLIVLTVLVAYALLLLFGAIIPSNAHFQADKNGMDLYIHTNGMHASFILPAKNAAFDWTPIIRPDLFEIKGSSETFLGFGWGDRAIYLDIVEWNELTVGLAFRTLFLPTTPLMHIEAYQQLPTTNILQTRVSKEQYINLCKFIHQTFALDQANQVKLIPGRGYTNNDQFYEAVGKYHAFNTCNTWAYRALKQIGVRTASWTSIDRAIFYQFKKIKPVSNPEVMIENQET